MTAKHAKHLTCLSVEPDPHEAPCLLFSQGPRGEALEEINAASEKNLLWLRKKKRKAFYTAVACENFRAGAESMLQVSAAPEPSATFFTVNKAQR